MKCTPWKANDNTLKAWETQAYNTYSAFEITYSAYFKTKGSIEFKYRKDTKNSYIINGELKFAINNNEVLVDNSYKNTTNWQVFKHDIASPGMYTFVWVYTKYSEKDVTDAMNAEIEVSYHHPQIIVYST
jgi:hypothetical protein